MATTYHGGGAQSPTSLSKPIERVFEDAQHTGEILLSCRKLREYPKLASKYDLVDTISADLSKNRLNEVPKEACQYVSMEKLNCYHNVIKVIPEALIQLQALTYLNLSRNQLSIIPVFISQMQALEVLIASHNRLVSLPEEIGVLDKLMELDVSCNEISHLPLQIGDLKSLKSLNVRRNFLQELPIEISKLNLRKLDISANRISKIPTLFRKIETLEDIILENNPLTLPPAHVCIKGKQHIMKYLQTEANREEKKRGILNEQEMKRYRKSLPPQQSVSSEEFRNLMESPDKWKRHTVLSSDSGYSTADSIEKSWSPQEELQRQKQEYENQKKIAAQLRQQQEEEDEREQRRRAAQRIQDEQRALLERQREESRAQDEARQREIEESRRQEEAQQREEAHRIEEARKREEARRIEENRQQEEAKHQRAQNKKPALSASNSFKEERRPAGTTQQYRRTTSDSNQRLPVHQPQQAMANGPIEEQPTVNGSTPTNQSTDSSPNTSFNSQTSAPTHRSPNVVNGPTSDSPPETETRKAKTSTDRGPSTMTSRVAKPTTDRSGKTSTSGLTRTGVPTARRTNLMQSEEMRKSQQNLKGSAQTDGQKARSEQRLKTIQKEAVNNYLNRRSSGSTSSEDGKRSTPTRSLAYQGSSSAASKRSGTGTSTSTRVSTTTTRTSTTRVGATTPRAGATTTTTASAGQPRRARRNSNSSTTSVSSTTSKTSVDKSKRSGTVMTTAHVKMLEDYNKDSGPNYTMRRQHEQQRDGHEQMEKLRKTISTRLKRSLPENLSEALSDGVLLCHLANQIRPRSVASVHVPSPAVPKLTPAKCRRNVDNFLEACRKIGVPKDQICGPSDILEEKGVSKVAVTVSALVAIATQSKHPTPSNV